MNYVTYGRATPRTSILVKMSYDYKHVQLNALHLTYNPSFYHYKPNTITKEIKLFQLKNNVCQTQL